MKTILYFISAMLVFTGCQDVLHEEDTAIGKIENYDQLVSATGGLYGILASALPFKTFYDANLKGDDLATESGYYERYYHGDVVDCWKSYYLGIKNAYLTSDSWYQLYHTIVSANNIICQFNIRRVKDKRTSQMLAEVYVIRAYCYFRLTRTTGQIPFISDIDIKYNVTKPSFTEIYNFIESDLKTAEAFLPTNNSAARVPYVTPHRGTVKALLAELYLSWAGYPIKDHSKYTLAAKEAGEAIDSAGYFGMALVSDFTYLWDKAHLLNSESVFSLYVNYDQLKTWADYWASGYVGFSDQGSWQLSRGGTKFVTYFYPVEVNFFNNYPECYRKEITFFATLYVPQTNYGTAPDTGYVHISTVTPCSRVAYRKFYYEPYEFEFAMSENFKTHFFLGAPRVYLFRFAQTVLTYAEAMARSGQLNADAYESVNQIRRRAHHLDLNTPSAYDLPAGLPADAFADSVVQERAWELCGEPEGRWFDLVRLEMVETLPTLRHPNEGGPPVNFDKSEYFFNPPASDTLLNPHLRH